MCPVCVCVCLVTNALRPGLAVASWWSRGGWDGYSYERAVQPVLLRATSPPTSPHGISRLANRGHTSGTAMTT